MTYTIRRPPIHQKTFSMPSKKEIESLHEGSIVKVVFLDSKGENGERMWTKIQSIDEEGYVTATLDNQPFGNLPLNLNDTVKFHVTDIIMVD